MTRLIQWFLGLSGALLIAAFLSPFFGRQRDREPAPICMSNLKQIGLGILQYTQDYNDRHPLVKGDLGWAKALQPYLKSVQIFQCPVENTPPQEQTDPRMTGYTDYFYNSQFANRDLGAKSETLHLIMAADGNDGQENTDASYSKPGIPNGWRTDNSSPAFRHHEWANYLFVDSHVKAVKVRDISTDWSATKYYFQPPKLTNK